MGFLDFIGDVGKGIAEPFDIVGRGVSEVLSGGARQKQYDSYLKRQNEINESLLKSKQRLKDADDPAEIERLMKFISTMEREARDVKRGIEETSGEVEKNTDARKFAASAADIGLTIGSAGTYGAATRGAKTGAVLGSKQIAKNLSREAAKKGAAKTLVRTVTPNVAEGAVGGALGALEQDEVNAGTIAAGAGVGALFGAAIPAAQYKFGNRAAKKYISSGAGRNADEAIDFTGIDRAAADFADEVNPSKQASQTIDNPIRPPSSGFVDEITPTRAVADEAADETVDTASKIASNTVDPEEGSARALLRSKIKSSSEIAKETKKPLKDRANEQLLDKLSPLNKLVKDVEGKTGKKLTTSENPYEMGRLYAGMPAKVKQQVNQFAKLMEDAPDLEAMKELGIARRVLGRPDIKGVISVDDANKVIAELQEQFSPEDFARLNSTVDGVVEYNKSLFRALGDADIFEKGAIEEIIENNPDYFTKYNVVSKILNNAQGNVDQLKPGQSFNLSRQNVMKALKGVDDGEELLDPIESVIGSTDQIMRTIEKNNIFRSVQNLADDTDIVIRTRNADDVLQRMALSGENKELRPIRNKIAKKVSTRAKSLRKLETMVNNLNKQGLDESLKKTKEGLPEFTPGGLGGKVPTSKAGQAVTTTVDEKKIFDALGEEIPQNASKLGPSDTRAFLNSLVEGDGKKLAAIKKKIGTREPKISSLIEEIEGLRGEYSELATRIRNNFDEASDLSDLKIPDGYERISGWRKGVREDIAIPAEIAQAYKGLNTAQLDQATSFMNKVNQVMKTSVTSLNVPFAVIRNPVRDFKTMAANSQNIPPQFRKIVKAWVKGAWEGYKGVTGTFGGSELYDDWIAAGGGGSGIYSRLDSAEKIAKNIKDSSKGFFEVNEPKDILKVLKNIGKAPIDAVQNAGAVLESAPRLAEFDAAVKGGKGLRDAAFDSRNVTVDFSQSGKTGQVLNAWVPFLNARLQGNKKLIEAAARDPKRFARIYGTLTAVPIAATALINAQNQEVMDQIPDYVKDANFIIALGDAKDENGKFTQVVKIPKSDIDKIFGNPLENFIAFARGKDPEGIDEMLTQMASNLSLVDFEKDGGFNASRTASGLTPVAIKAPLEFITNRNLYFDSPTVSESMSKLPNNMQVSEDTSLISKGLGAITGQSPEKTEQFLRSTTGSLTTSDPATQLVNTLAGASSSAPKSEFYRTLDTVSPLRARASKLINDAIAAGDINSAQSVAEDFNNRLKEAFTPWVRQYGKYADEELQELYDEQKINLTSRSVSQRRRNLEE